jgi:hypothetical protein
VSPLRFVAFALLPVICAASLAPARGANALVPGTYNQVSPVTQRVMRVGNEVVLQADRHGRLHFSLNAIRGSDDNMGFIGGVLQRAVGPVVWTNTERYARCRLTFVPVSGPVLRVRQDLRFGDCGFGYGVSGDGLYQRTRPGGKLGPWNGP